MQKICPFIVLLLLPFRIYAQHVFPELDSLLEKQRFDEAVDWVRNQSTADPYGLEVLYMGRIYLQQRRLDSAFYYLMKVDTAQLAPLHLASYYMDLSSSYGYVNEEDREVELKLKAKEIYERLGEEKLANQINYDLFYALIAQDGLYYKGTQYLNEFYRNALKWKDSKNLVQAHISFAILNWSPEGLDSAKFHFQRAFSHLPKANSKKLEAVTHQYKGLFYAANTSYLDTASFHIDRSFEIYDSLGLVNQVYASLKNKAELERIKNNPQKALEYLLVADTLAITTNIDPQKSHQYEYMAFDYANLGDYKNAYEHLKKSLNHTNQQKLLAQNTNITRLRTLEAEKQNIYLATQKVIQQNIYLSVTGFLLALLLIIWLIYKNTKKKQLIAEKETEITGQKIEKLLKEQEMVIIDAMIGGQEKERQRLANDLHDDLGSTLASLKIHFQNLKTSNGSEILTNELLYDKTYDLLEEAYQKVRLMAHAKNLGVMAKEGLLPAVQNLAGKISNFNGIQIQVVTNQLNTRLDNTMEITLFRMIQELVTNMVKHSKATEGYIYITHHFDTINLIVEDNGIGFDSGLVGKDGMGLDSIAKRVGFLGGTFVVDSKKGKGSTIIIEIPLNI